jgi:hypothetical protein
MQRSISRARRGSGISLRRKLLGIYTLIIGIFAANWLVSMLVYRLKRYDEIEVTRG